MSSFYELACIGILDDILIKKQLINLIIKWFSLDKTIQLHFALLLFPLKPSLLSEETTKLWFYSMVDEIFKHSKFSDSRYSDWNGWFILLRFFILNLVLIFQVYAKRKELLESFCGFLGYNEEDDVLVILFLKKLLSLGKRSSKSVFFLFLMFKILIFEIFMIMILVVCPSWWFIELGFCIFMILVIFIQNKIGFLYCYDPVNGFLVGGVKSLVFARFYFVVV